MNSLSSDNGGTTIFGATSDTLAVTACGSRTYVDDTIINQPTLFVGSPSTFLGTQTIDPNGSVEQ